MEAPVCVLHTPFHACCPTALPLSSIPDASMPGSVCVRAHVLRMTLSLFLAMWTLVCTDVGSFSGIKGCRGITIFMIFGTLKCPSHMSSSDP